MRQLWTPDLILLHQDGEAVRGVQEGRDAAKRHDRGRGDFDGRDRYGYDCGGNRDGL